MEATPNPFRDLAAPYRTKVIAQVLNVNVCTVSTWRKAGAPPSRVDELKAWIAAGAQAPSAN